MNHDNSNTQSSAHDKSPSQLETASMLQQTAEQWQAFAIQQQAVASLLQRAAVHERELIAQCQFADDKTLENQLRYLEESLLKLVDTAFAIEGIALEQVKRAIKQTEDALNT